MGVGPLRRHREYQSKPTVKPAEPQKPVEQPTPESPQADQPEAKPRKKRGE